MLWIDIPETEEIADFLLGRRGGNALDINNVVSRHDGVFSDAMKGCVNLSGLLWTTALKCRIYSVLKHLEEKWEEEEKGIIESLVTSSRMRHNCMT